MCWILNICTIFLVDRLIVRTIESLYSDIKVDVGENKQKKLKQGNKELLEKGAKIKS